MATTTIITGPDNTPKAEYANRIAGLSFIERVTPTDEYPFFTYEEETGTAYIAENLERDGIINLIDFAMSWEDDVQVIIITSFPVHNIDFAEMTGKVAAVIKMVDAD